MNIPSNVGYKLIKKLWDYIYKEGRASEHQYVPLGAIGVISFIIYYFIWSTVAPTEYTNVPMRIIGAVLCLLLMLKDYWPRFLQPILPLYWFSTLLYCFPFFFCFMLFKNPDSNVWMLTAITGLFFLMLLLNWVMLISIVSLGVAAAWFTYVMTTPVIVVPVEFINTLPTYLTVLIAGSIFIYRDTQVQNEKLNGLITLSGAIAHELRTPLRAIDSNNDGLIKLLPQLTQAYTVAKEHNLDIPFIPPQQFIALDHLTESIKLETYAAFTFIDMLLLKTKSSGEGQEQHDYSMRTCVETAIARYPLSEEERSSIVIKLTGEDFIFHANDYFVMHIFFNLIKNAIYYIHKAQKGDIQIWLEPGEPFNTVHFKDTGTGIAKRDLSRIFERFFSRTHRGTGLGLAFSKMVMESIGGKITCQSVLGEYTEFILRFPVVKRTT
jgi:signal transduction histidine kinase